MQPAQLLKKTRETNGISIRQLATAASVSPSTIHRIEKSELSPTVEMLERIFKPIGMVFVLSAEFNYATSAFALSSSIADDVSNKNEKQIIRKVSEFVARFKSCNKEEQEQILALAPTSTGDARWDAFVAALAEWLSATSRISAPSWCFESNKYLPNAWWVTRLKSMHAWEFAGTPAAFKCRGVYIHRDSLENV